MEYFFSIFNFSILLPGGVPFCSPACGVIQKSCFFMLPAARKSCKSF